MLEFAIIPGLTKIFNRDDWQKVFLACATLPDYREKKYASYFITKDAEARAGKLYYRLTYLSRGGRKYEPISHDQLVNAVATGQNPYLCFGPGEKYEFQNYIMCAKYEEGKRNVSTDMTFVNDKEYYYDATHTMEGYSERVVHTKPDETKEYYGRYEGWSIWKYEPPKKDSSSSSEAEDVTKYEKGWSDKFGTTGKPWYIAIASGEWTQHPSDLADETAFKAAVALARDGKLYTKITETATTKHYTYGFTLGEKLEDKGYPIYDYEVIGDQKFVEGRKYYKKSVTGLREDTEDETFQPGVTYYCDTGAGYITKMTARSTTPPATRTNWYKVGENIQERITAVKAAAPGMSTYHIGDTLTSREYRFDALSDTSTGTAITKTWLQTNANDYLYYLNTANIFYTIDEDLGSLTLVTYLSTGSKLCDSMFAFHSDKTFRSTRKYFVREPWTLKKESGYRQLDATEYGIGNSIATWELLNGKLVYQQVEEYYIVKNNFVGQITHDKDFYERAGSNFPYEGFVAVTTERGDNQSRGSLYLCRRRTYQLTEDMTHGYTGNQATGKSKTYYEFHEKTGKYVEADPVYRNPASSSFAEVTEDDTFQDNKKYYSDLGLIGLLEKGTKAQVLAGEADYYVAEGSEPGMPVADYKGTVYDRYRSFYWRGTGENLWNFTKITPPTERKGLTTDKYWDYDATPGSAKLNKSYYFYSGAAYTFSEITTLYSGVTDTIFGYHDLTDSFYGYTKLRFGSKSKITAGDADMISGTTVGSYKSTHSDVTAIYRETGGVLDLTNPLGDDVEMKENDGSNYHFRNTAHVPDIASGSVESVYYKYDASEKQIIATPLTVAKADIGKSIGAPVYSRYSKTERPVYYYMINKDDANWDTKFEIFQLTFDITPSTGGAVQSKIDDDLGYYRKQGDNYMRDTTVTAGMNLDNVYEPTTDTKVVSGKTYYILDGGVYVVATGLTPGEAFPVGVTHYEKIQFYEYSGTYLGRPITTQPKTIYRKDHKGTVPEEIPICVKYLGDGATKEIGESYADGEEIPEATALYVISNNGENILRDEYYEECYGLYYWDQFFLDRGISANPVTDVDCFFTANSADCWDTEDYFMFLKWKDPTIMIKKDQPYSSPDEWDRTDVVLHYENKTYTLLTSQSKDLYADSYLKLSLDKTSDSRIRTVDGQELWTLLERDFSGEGHSSLTRSLFTALRKGYIEITATSQTGMTSTYKVKPKEVVWWADTEAEKAATLTIEGMTPSTYRYVDLSSTTAIPGVVYYDINTDKECTDVYPYASSINFMSTHKLKYDGKYPIVKVYRNTGVVEPITIGNTVTLGADIVFPDADAGYYLATPCITDNTGVPNYPKVSVVELVRDGRIKNIIDVGGEITVPLKLTASAAADTSDAKVVDFDHVLPARRVEMGYTNAGSGAAVAGTKYYAQYKTTSVCTTFSGGNFEFKEAVLAEGAALNGKFYTRTAVPHYQFYTMSRDETSGMSVYTEIVYDAAGAWKNKVENPNVQIFYKDEAYGVGGTYFKYETLTGSMTLRTNNQFRISSSIGTNYSTGDDCSGVWNTSDIRTWFVANMADRITDASFLKCVSNVFNTQICQQFENYDSYELTLDKYFQADKTYYKYNGTSYVVATVVVGEEVPADTYYEKFVKARPTSVQPDNIVTRDQFWLPTANNLGFTSLPDPSTTRVSLTLPVPAEGSLLDAYNPHMNSSMIAPNNSNIAKYSLTRGDSNICRVDLDPVNWWLRTMPDSASDFKKYVTYVTTNGNAAIVECDSKSWRVFPFFTIG